MRERNDTMKVPEKYYCDICGNELHGRGKISGVVYLGCNTWVYDMATDRIELDGIDICHSCRAKMVNITKRKVINEDGNTVYRYDIIAPEPAKEAYTAEQYAHDRARLCQRTNCCTCPLSSTARGESSVVCSQFLIHYPAEAVEIVRKWAAEHPEAADVTTY